MGIPAELFSQPEHRIVQKPRTIEVRGCVKISDWQDRPMPINTAAQRAGIRYEARVERVLDELQKKYGATLYSHIWFDFDGKSAQTDFFMVFPSGGTLLFEAKHTWVDTAQQRALYRKLLEAIGFSPVITCTICARLTQQTPREKIIHSLTEIEEGAIWQLRV